MKVKRLTSIAIVLLGATLTAFGLDGQIGTHDPSTVMECNGRYYCYGTGNGIPIMISDDGWTWRRAGSVMASLPGGRPGEEVLRYAGGNNGTSAWAPDVIKVGDRYLLYYALSGQKHKAVVGLLFNKTLDPNSPDYKWEDGGPVAWSLGEGVDDLHAIDPGVMFDPGHGTLWLVYGSYYGNIRLAQLDPKTGKRLAGQPSDDTIVANQSEAPIMICHEVCYDLFTNKGTCCAGATSTYNIRVARSISVKGPFLDDQGVDMARGGGTPFVASGDGKIGPGHFGLLDLGDGVQRFSCHYEADLDHPGSVLDIRPLLWRDGWPVAGDNVRQGTYQVMSRRSGTVLELAVPGVPVMEGRRRGGAPGTAQGGEPAAAQAGGVRPIATVAQASQSWPTGPVEVRMAAYLLQAQQLWTIAPVPNAGGTPGSPYFRFTVAGTDRTLTTTEDDELIALPSFTRAQTQLWRIDPMADGSYRIAPKSTKDKLALTSIGRSTVTLAPFTEDNPNQRWLLSQP